MAVILLMAAMLLWQPTPVEPSLEDQADNLDRAADEAVAAAEADRAADEALDAAGRAVEAAAEAILQSEREGWRQIGSNDDGMRLLIHNKTGLLARPNGRANRVWVKYDARKVKSVPFMESLQLVEVDCINETYKVLSNVWYYRNGKTQRVSVNQLEVNYAVPDTNSAAFTEAACPAS